MHVRRLQLNATPVRRYMLATHVHTHQTRVGTYLPICTHLADQVAIRDIMNVSLAALSGRRAEPMQASLERQKIGCLGSEHEMLLWSSHAELRSQPCCSWQAGSLQDADPYQNKPPAPAMGTSGMDPQICVWTLVQYTLYSRCRTSSTERQPAHQTPPVITAR